MTFRPEGVLRMIGIREDTPHRAPDRVGVKNPNRHRAPRAGRWRARRRIKSRMQRASRRINRRANA